MSENVWFSIKPCFYKIIFPNDALINHKVTSTLLTSQLRVFYPCVNISPAENSKQWSNSKKTSFKIVLYIPCGPAAGQYSMLQHNLLGQPSHHTLEVHEHKLHKRSYLLLYVHKQSVRRNKRLVICFHCLSTFLFQGLEGKKARHKSTPLKICLC